MDFPPRRTQREPTPRSTGSGSRAAREFDVLEFFHIKLELHDVIYAEGALCETLVNVDENAVNFADYLREYGPSTAEAAPCAPLIRYGYRRGEIKSCFRSAISPWYDRR